MKNLWILLFIFFYTSLSGAQDIDSRRNQLLEVLGQEIREVKRLSSQKNNRDANLLLRLSELYLESARLLKERENQRYLSIPPRERSKKKSEYFRGSTKFFNAAQSTSFSILKRFRRFKKKNEVYYILAFNAKEFQKFKTAKKYFRLAVKYSSKKSVTWRKAQLALAELLFNEKRYRQAVRIYAPLLRVRDSKWWTKDSFNLAQSYYNLKQYTKAIKTMRKVYDFSSDKNYIDMSSQASRELALYYSTSGRVNEALQFFRNSKLDAGAALIKLGRHLVDKGKLSQAEDVLSSAIKSVQSDKDKAEVYLILLGLYEKFGRVSKHLKTSKDLLSVHRQTPLTGDELESFKYTVKKMASTLQKQVISKTYKRLKTTQKQKAKMAVDYFEISAELDNKGSPVDTFASAETLYASGSYSSALDQYDKAYGQAKRAGNVKILRLSVNAMLATLGRKGISKSQVDRYLIPTYNRFLKINPRSSKTEKILQKLFQNYFDKKDLVNAEKVLVAYRNRYPRGAKVQEAMLAKIIDYYKGQKDKGKVQEWVNKIRKREFNVSPAYAKKVKLLLLTLQFENVEKLTSQGQKKDALQGYFSIYNSPNSSSAAKKNAAYNIAILFHELGRVDPLYTWTKRALDLMSSKDVYRFRKDYLTLTTELFHRRRLNQSAEMSVLTLKKICNYRAKVKDTYFKNSYVLYLAEGQIDRAVSLIAVGQSCKVSTTLVKTAQFDILKSYEESGRWTDYEKLVNELSKSKVNWGKLILPLFKLRSVYKKAGRVEYAQRFAKDCIRYYDYSKRKNLPVELESLDVVAHLKLKSVEEQIRKMKAIRLSFPEDKFNQLLQQKFGMLDRFTSDALKVLETGSGKGIVKSYQYLVETYQQLVSEVRSFTPPGKSPDYVKSFQQSMQRLTNPILSKSKDFIREARTQITRNNILSHDSYWFFSNNRLPIALEYRYGREGIIMDRGGKR